MSERKSLASRGASTVLCACFSVVPSVALAQSAPDAGAARVAPEPVRSDVVTIDARQLANGLTVVRAQSSSLDPTAVGVTLAVPLGEGRADSGAWRAVLERVSASDARCDRLGITTQTHSDRAFTEFVSRVPSAAIELALWREAQRLDSLSSSESTEVRSLHRRAFDPRNAVLVVVAHGSARAAVDAAIERTVAMIPTRNAQAPSLRPAQPPPDGWAASADIAIEQRWWRQWGVVGARSPDHYALELLSFSLRDARFGPLARLLQERSIRSAIISDAYLEHRADEDRLHWSLRYAASRAGNAPLDQLANELLSRLARQGILGSDLRSARERWRLQWLQAQSSVDTFALRLARFEARWGNARLALTEVDRYDAVTVQDVLRVLNERIVSTSRRAAAEVR